MSNRDWSVGTTLLVDGVPITLTCNEVTVKVAMEELLKAVEWLRENRGAEVLVPTPKAEDAPHTQPATIEDPKPGDEDTQKVIGYKWERTKQSKPVLHIMTTRLPQNGVPCWDDVFAGGPFQTSFEQFEAGEVPYGEVQRNIPDGADYARVLYTQGKRDRDKVIARKVTGFHP